MTSPLNDALQRRFAFANLIAQLGIIATGGLVRVSGSGLGCSTWPMCEPGTFTPVFHEATSWHPYIEFGNRTLTGVLVVIAVGLLWSLIRKGAVPRRDLIPWAWGVIALIAVQAVVGGISVRVTLHPAVVGLHMALSLGLVALSAYIVYLVHHPRFVDEHSDEINGVVFEGRLSSTETALHLALGVFTVVVAILGVVVTGTGPYSGDERQPYRFAIDPLLITRTHSISAWVLLALVLASAYLAYRRSSTALKPWLFVVGALFAQGLIGYIQYFTGLARPLVILHMLGSGVTVVAVTWAIATVYARRLAPYERASEIDASLAPGSTGA